MISLRLCRDKWDNEMFSIMVHLDRSEDSYPGWIAELLKPRRFVAAPA